MSSTSPVPNRYHSVTPCLIIDAAVGVIEFILKAFGGNLEERHDGADGSVMHAEVRIGDSLVMISQAGGEWRAMPGVLHLYVDDCDAYYARAIAAGATSLREPTDQSYSDRNAGVVDAAGKSLVDRHSPLSSFW